jgi:hypothetical protein
MSRVEIKAVACDFAGAFSPCGKKGTTLEGQMVLMKLSLPVPGGKMLANHSLLLFLEKLWKWLKCRAERCNINYNINSFGQLL